MSTFWKFDQNDSISLAIRYILPDKKKNIYFQLQNEKFWLNVQDTYLAAFIQKKYFLFHLPKYYATLFDLYWKTFAKVWKTQLYDSQERSRCEVSKML